MTPSRVAKIRPIHYCSSSEEGDSFRHVPQCDGSSDNDFEFEFESSSTTRTSSPVKGCCQRYGQNSTKNWGGTPTEAGRWWAWSGPWEKILGYLTRLFGLWAMGAMYQELFFNISGKKGFGGRTDKHNKQNACPLCSKNHGKTRRCPPWSYPSHSSK